jgi:hypothetical protein
MAENGNANGLSMSRSRGSDQNVEHDQAQEYREGLLSSIGMNNGAQGNRVHF